MSKHWFVIIGITLFTGCYPAAKMTQGLVGITSDYCSDQHRYWQPYLGCYLKQPYDNYGITKRNANDIVAGRCLLLHAVWMVEMMYLTPYSVLSRTQTMRP